MRTSGRELAAWGRTFINHINTAQSPNVTVLTARPPERSRKPGHGMRRCSPLLLRDAERLERTNRAFRSTAALTEFNVGLSVLPSPDTYGVECQLHLGIGWITEEAGDLTAAIEQYERAIALAVRPPEALSQVFLRLAKCRIRSGATAQAQWAASQAITVELAAARQTAISRSATEIVEEVRNGARPRGGPNESVARSATRALGQARSDNRGSAQLIPGQKRPAARLIRA